MIKLVIISVLATVAFSQVSNIFNNPEYLKYQKLRQYQQYQNQYDPNNPFRTYDPNNPFRTYDPNNPLRTYDPSNPFKVYDPETQYNQYRRYNLDNKQVYQDPEYYQKYYKDGKSGILRFENNIRPDGGYQYGYQTENGISVEEQGVPKAVGTSAPIVVQGFYGYTSPEGKPIQVRYTADEDGFHPVGDAIPTSPPTPDYILRSIQYNAVNNPGSEKK